MWKPAERESAMSTSGNSRRRSRLSISLLVFLIPALALAGASPTSRPASWTPLDNAPTPRADSGSLAFPCRFDSEHDRCAWDGPASAFRSDAAGSYEVTLSAEQPERIRAVTLYLRSGDGWYAAELPTPDAAPRPFRVAAARFVPEGQPAGLDRIDGVRLAVWKRTAGEATLRLHRTGAATRVRVRILQAEDAAPAGERELAAALAQRVSGWLDQAGIRHALVTESEWLAQPPAADTRFLLLPYAPRPGPALLRALQAVMADGGKLLVCYGASPELARAMGFRLAPYLAAPTPLTWSAFRFDPPVGPIVRIGQESSNLIPVFPASPDSRVLAWWEDAAGNRRPEPAWVGGPAGFWMSHVLDPEDAALKTRLLLEWIGETVPEAWEQAGTMALARTARAALPDKAQAALRKAAARRDWRRVMDESARLQAEAARRMAASLPPAPPSESAAVWIQPGPGRMPDDWPRLAPALRQSGIRRLYLSAVDFGRAHFQSRYWPRSAFAESSRPPFEAILETAPAAGLSVQAWVTCFNVAYAPPARLAAWRLAGRLMQTPAGEQSWLTPTHPDNRAWLLAAIGDLAGRFPVDGIHLDYIRYPDQLLDLSPSARTGFEASGNGPVAQWPAEVLPGGARHDAYRRWLMELLDQFVQSVRDEIRRQRPGIRLSAAVYPAYPYCRDGVLQDWQRWLENGWVDEICPMSYTDKPEEFAGWLDTYRTLPGWGSRIFPGIGVFSDQSPLDPEGVLTQIRLIRERGGAGPVFFLANRTFLRDILPLLQPALD